ncbi:unnamed protein product [Bursaphelenchus okinawaensis]|uniref:G_PROTEIN_RECEP_F1_2 domain-containing protein n=1 Tax=Bursaphelenchus okinawaensis TaxID=465554 RepID=A0A811KRE0_9BILA|nr:unnamed protein product [Bursaphelenchus okinawaensis]CAG9112322.1 unnamed protein product [Bursaphelenchus okinawaensis]
MLPALVFELLPIFGFLLCVSTGFYLWIMRKKQKDAFAGIYVVQCLDFAYGISLFYAGFHGCFISANSDDNSAIQPVDCLYRAIHISLWCVLDLSNFIVIFLLCFDQLVSVIWTKKHKVINSLYMSQKFILAMVTLSMVILVPAWNFPLSQSDNSTIRVSPFCTIESVFSSKFYRNELNMRQYAPLIGVIMLSLAGFSLLVFQLLQNWSFKWSDNNEEAERFYFFVLTRCIMLLAVVHFPLYVLSSHINRQDPILEILLRIAYAVMFGLLEPITLFKLFPEYRTEFYSFFLRYSHNTKRTWQSAEDPPESKEDVGKEGLDFGSWYSSAGNIIGEAGVPYEMNADKQKSVSFYYNEMEKV